MKTALPDREDYFRLTRARELREKVRRVDWRWWLVAAVWLVGGAWLLWAEQLELFSVAHGFGTFAWFWFCWWTGTRTERFLKEADRLEAEHQARHGAPAQGSQGAVQRPWASPLNERWAEQARHSASLRRP
jgi:hypothetical protein